MRRDDLSGLAAFLTVAKERSFTRTAARLGLTQCTLSHAVRGFEERPGLRLLTRTTRSVVPTPAGERLIRAARPGLEAVAAELAALGELRDKPAGTVRITTSAHAHEAILWPALRRLVPLHPDVEVEVVAEHRFADIVAERFDAGIRLGEAVERDMVAVRIGPELRWIVVGALACLARHPRPAASQDLTAQRCINDRQGTSGGLCPWEFEREGRALAVRVEGPLAFNDPGPALAAAVEGFGLALCARGRRRGALAGGPPRPRARRLVPARAPGYHLHCPSRRQMAPALALVVEGLRWPGRSSEERRS